jgi:catechol 2,3-dioxygenase-like lactoylglutathione lyase family enzyme
LSRAGELDVETYGGAMKNWYSRPVFFVSDPERSVAFYTEKLGFALDWNHEEEGRAYVCQVSRDGFELILAKDVEKAGRGRVFISLDKTQEKALRNDIIENGIEARDTRWGMPIVEILDLDRNELFFSPP